MGKTANGAIWLNEDKLNTWDFWQFWRNTEDKDVIRFLKLFTEVPISQIQEIQKLKGAQINDAKILLANEVTKLCHGTEAAIKAHKSAKNTFEQGKLGLDLPRFKVVLSKNDSISLIEALCKTELCKSKGEARRLINGGGARINNQSFRDEDHVIQKSDFDETGTLKISSGKKNHAVLYF